MIKAFSITSEDFEFGTRLVPSYYYYTKIIKKNNEKKGIRYIKLDQISEKISDGEHSHIQRHKTKGIRYLYGRNIKEGIINFDTISDNSYISEEDYENFKRCHIKQNDILITIYGTVGKSALYKKEYVGKAGIPRHISKITLKNDSPLTGEFITAYFRSKIGKGQLLNITTGNIQQLLSLKNIKKLDLPLPDDDFIDKITKTENTAIDCEIKALELMEKAKCFLYNRIDIDFSQINKELVYSVGLFDIYSADLWTPTYSYPLYLNTLKAIQNKWHTVPLGEIATVKKGDEVGSDNYNEYLDKKDGDIPFIRTSDIVNYEADQFPDFYIPEEIYKELKQDIREGDVLFTKDGKIGMTGMITKNDKVIIASGISRLRLKAESKKYNLTPEYLFLIMSLKETGLYPAIRRTVIASTIPHLREERLRDIELPILDKNSIDEITKLVKIAFEFKDEKKKLIKEVREEMDGYFEI